MGKRRQNTQIRMDAALAALRETDRPLRCDDVASRIGCHYEATYTVLRHLESDGTIERAEVRHLIPLDDKVMDMGPNTTAVAWRPVDSDLERLASLEALWGLPAAVR